MNILFITQSEPFYIKYFFRIFLNKCTKYNIKGIVIQDPFNQKQLSRIIKRVIYFYGIKGFLKMCFKYLIIKSTDFASKFLDIQVNASIEQIVKKHAIPILNYKSVNNKEFIDFIKKENIDLVISVAASEIFRYEVLHTPNYGCINIHSAPLPKYRGMMPNFWTLYNNEEYAWVTIHKMVEKLDDGSIILQDKFKIINGETYDSLAKRSKEFAARLLLKTLEQIEEGEVNYLSNDSSKATYFTFPTKDEVRQFKKMGGRII